MTQKQNDLERPVVALDPSLFHEVSEGRHSIVLVDSNPDTSRIRVGDNIRLINSADASSERLVTVQEVFLGETYEDVLRMLPPDDVTVQKDGPLSLLDRLESFHERNGAGKNFGVMGLRIRLHEKPVSG